MAVLAHAYILSPTRRTLCMLPLSALCLCTAHMQVSPTLATVYIVYSHVTIALVSETSLVPPHLLQPFRPISETAVSLVAVSQSTSLHLAHQDLIQEVLASLAVILRIRSLLARLCFDKSSAPQSSTVARSKSGSESLTATLPTSTSALAPSSLFLV